MSAARGGPGTRQSGVDLQELVGGLRRFLPRQRWFSGRAEPAEVRLHDARVEREGWPALLSLIVEVVAPGPVRSSRATRARQGARYHVLVGLRPVDQAPEALQGNQEAVIGELAGDEGTVLAYDAAADPELALVLLDVVSGGTERAARVRPLGGEQSNSSFVYDDRLILKVFRRVHRGPNPEVEMTSALDSVGFPYVAQPLGTWRCPDEDLDLAVLQPYLAGGVDGWALALTSVRDLFGVSDTQRIPVISDATRPPAPHPSEAGGDFSAEARRLGDITGELHLALAEALGLQPGDPQEWAAGMEDQLARVSHPAIDRRGIDRVIDEVRSVPDAGAAIRIHGDYHLGQVMRTDSGWYVLDFEGEPAAPLAERRRPSSPLRDVAGMLRSFQYAATSAALGRVDEGTLALARRWEAHNRRAFLEGYLARTMGAGILPRDPHSQSVLLRGFELQKAVYEVGYEQGHRPDWVEIPLAALGRLVSGEQAPAGGPVVR